jgi:hypothetical protein
MTRRVLLAVAAVIVAAACASDSTQAEPNAAASLSGGSSDYVASQNGCDEASTRRVVASFLSALNSGDVAAADRHVAADDGTFRFFADTANPLTVPAPGSRVPNEDSYVGQRDSVEPQLAVIVGAGERIEMQRFGFAGILPATGQAEFGFGGVRGTSANLRSFDGKGTLDCRSMRIAMLTIGAPAP